MEILVKYGRTAQRLPFPVGMRVSVLAPGQTAGSGGETDMIRSALADPIGSPRLSRSVSPGQQVVIVTSDITRPCPTARLLPHVLEEPHQAGVADSDVTVVFGRGTHRPHTRKEQETQVGPAVFRRVRCFDSDPADVEHVGTTRRGTPVDVFRPVCRADVRILLGVIEYHYFAGYSGGLKALVPGVCGEATLQANHRWRTEPGAITGNLEHNPVRDDIDEAGELFGAQFRLNVVLDEETGGGFGSPRAGRARRRAAPLRSRGRSRHSGASIGL